MVQWFNPLSTYDLCLFNNISVQTSSCNCRVQTMVASWPLGTRTWLWRRTFWTCSAAYALTRCRPFPIFSTTSRRSVVINHVCLSCLPVLFAWLPACLRLYTFLDFITVTTSRLSVSLPLAGRLSLAGCLGFLSCLSVSVCRPASLHLPWLSTCMPVTLASNLLRILIYVKYAKQNIRMLTWHLYVPPLSASFLAVTDPFNGLLSSFKNVICPSIGWEGKKIH